MTTASGPKMHTIKDVFDERDALRGLNTVLKAALIRIANANPNSNCKCPCTSCYMADVAREAIAKAVESGVSK